MTPLANATSEINHVIQNKIQGFVGLSTMTMPDGSMMILDPSTGDEFMLTQDQVDNFNEAYEGGLVNSTPEALALVKLQDMIDLEQSEYDSQKDELEEAAKEIATVTAVADMLVTGDQETKIAAEQYATDNELRAIDQGSVDQFNVSISGMLEASMTKNMLETYAMDSVVIDTIANQFMQTATIMDFFDNSVVSIDSLNHTQLNFDWQQSSVGVQSEMYNIYGISPDLTLSEYLQ